MRQRKWSRQRDALRKRRLAFDHYTCQACGLRDPSGRDLRLDEIVPLALGGAESWDNTQTLCWVCNGIKGMSAMTNDEVAAVRAARTTVVQRGRSIFSPRLSVDQAQREISPRWR